MFGYVRPARDRLDSGEWERYQEAYCGLCHCLRKSCGPAARFILNYDFVFLFLLLDGEEDGGCGRRRCPRHPWQGKPCLTQSPAMELCAWESVVLAYYKLGDGVADEGLWAGLGNRLARFLLTGAYRKARGHCSDFDYRVAMCLWELDELERENSPQLDRVADTFARLLSAAAPATGVEGLDRPRGQLLYHLGRWVYLADAVDDLVRDRERGRYNPVAARFGDQVDLDYLDTTMGHSLALAQSAFQLLPRTRWSGILENILYLGLPNVQRLVMDGRWNAKEDRHGRGRHA